jgi:hypothetical protein
MDLTADGTFQTAWDGKHVQILGPKNSDSLFFNYKGTFSVVFFTLVDANYQIICADLGCQGHISDGEVLLILSGTQHWRKTDFVYQCRDLYLG